MLLKRRRISDYVYSVSCIYLVCIYLLIYLLMYVQTEKKSKTKKMLHITDAGVE